MAKTRICPFCRESFEGETRCPDHDLELVPHESLEGDEGAPPPAPARGRVGLMLAAIVACVAFFLPFFEDEEGLRPPVSALGVALAGGESLWVAFLAPVVILGALFSIHDAKVLGRVRVALFFATVIGLASVLVALRRGVELAAGGGSTLTPGAGAYVLVAALTAMGILSLGLGRALRFSTRDLGGRRGSK